MGDVRQPQRCIGPDALPETTESLESLGIMLRQAPPRLPCQDTIELVASFLSRRSFSHGPRWKATAAYESSTVRKMRATPWQNVDRNTRDPCVFWPVHS